MGYEEEPKEPNHTSPKLLLFSQRFNKPELQGSCTPPPHTVATVPFQWEEAPGKPRSASTTTANDPPPQKSKSFRSLHLPPKMFTNYAKVGIINVLDGPYVGMHSSYSSPESVVSKSKWKMMMPFRKIMCKQASPVKLSSWSWDSFRDISSRGGGGGRGGRKACMRALIKRFHGDDNILAERGSHVDGASVMDGVDYRNSRWKIP
ncbi:hypothetical protein L6452_14922 [Arctium lappa]|uniref:Uncharacterized protein n=1 Tax=Arctium lappa TaxID=4217 RepID=A0ACB9CMK0_ARCLA|nr:hypothetical protein L6452_14922 [Arctium lappa]